MFAKESQEETPVLEKKKKTQGSAKWRRGRCSENTVDSGAVDRCGICPKRKPLVPGSYRCSCPFDLL